MPCIVSARYIHPPENLTSRVYLSRITIRFSTIIIWTKSHISAVTVQRLHYMCCSTVMHNIRAGLHPFTRVSCLHINVNPSLYVCVVCLIIMITCHVPVKCSNPRTPDNMHITQEGLLTLDTASDGVNVHVGLSIPVRFEL